MPDSLLAMKMLGHEQSCQAQPDLLVDLALNVRSGILASSSIQNLNHSLNRSSAVDQAVPDSLLAMTRMAQ